MSLKKSASFKQIRQEESFAFPAAHNDTLGTGVDCDHKGSTRRVDRLMGRDPAQRFMFIQNRAGEIDPELIDA
jgi:hypothetical protein